ncbi:MAG: 5-formyltetrahydrofolate cyclo-ligase [Magnetococcales bacterium]|nr:5-formyltetrahydrofolate cyclo-ligase [Magnetococcales bacterium]
MMPDKACLRRRFLKRRRGLSESQCRALSQAIFRNISQLPIFIAARTIGLYLPIQQEVDPTPLIAWAHRQGQSLFFFFFLGLSGVMNFLPYAPGDPLCKGAFGILEPCVEQRVSEAVTAEKAHELDLLITPLVAFDRRGVRLGYGGGYFDRFLQKAREKGGEKPFGLGIAYAIQEAQALPRETHDCLLSGVVTELETVFFT